MKLSDFHFELPEELIAQYPPTRREQSRLLCVKAHQLEWRDRCFFDLVELLHPGDLLVFNDTKVLPARLKGTKASGGRVEILLERIIAPSRFLAQIRASKAPKPGTEIMITHGITLQVLGRQNSFFELQTPDGLSAFELFETYGTIPLPPYIRRDAQALDHERYQTVYAKNPGAVAAPTAGLHFTPEIIQQLIQRGVNTGFLTLHVGSGTFSPVRQQDLSQHQMHHEYYEIPETLIQQINETRVQNKRVIAVGTTVVRTLEAAALNGPLHAGQGETDIFIYDNFEFKVVDALVTNFHLPESTLIMLVCAFAGYETTLGAYRHAVAEGYRFFSYGDAMFIEPST